MRHSSQRPSPQYSVTVNTIGNGTVTLNPPGGIYEEGTVVELAAMPDNGWQFDGWIGNATGSSNPISITLTSDSVIGATFIATTTPQYSLTVNAIGNGIVTLNPPGGIYNEGAVVELAATPDNGWQFEGWTGDTSGASNPISITLTSDSVIDATFIATTTPQYSVTVNTIGNGTVTLNPPGGIYRKVLW